MRWCVIVLERDCEDSKEKKWKRKRIVALTYKQHDIIVFIYWYFCYCQRFSIRVMAIACVANERFYTNKCECLKCLWFWYNIFSNKCFNKESIIEFNERFNKPAYVNVSFTATWVFCWKIVERIEKHSTTKSKQSKAKSKAEQSQTKQKEEENEKNNNLITQWDICNRFK